MRKNVTLEEAKKDPNLIVPLASDEIFYKVFGTPENVSNTEYLLSVFLGIPLKDLKGRVEVVSKSMNNLTVNSKNSEKDIVARVKISEPIKVTIEMNKYSTSDSTINRNVFYLSDIFSSGLDRGDEYSNINKSIQINFNPRSINQDNKPVIDKYTLRNDYNYELTDKFIVYQINLAELSNIWYNVSENKFNLDPLMILFGAIIWENEKDKFEEMIESKLMDKDIKKSIEGIVFDMNKDSFVIGRYYDREESRIAEWNAEIEEARKKSYDAGHASGLAEGKKIMIKELNNNGISLNLISKSSGLSIDEIKKIIEQD